MARISGAGFMVGGLNFAVPVIGELRLISQKTLISPENSSESLGIAPPIQPPSNNPEPNRTKSLKT